MEAISRSRLLNNLRRDLRQNYKTDESLSILNLSGREIEITDETTGITKIVYPRSIFHTNRPQSNIIVSQNMHFDDDRLVNLSRSYSSDYKDDQQNGSVVDGQDGHRQDGHRQAIYAKIHRSKIRNNFICIETPIKYVNEVGNYAEVLSIKWINKLLAKSDVFVITGFGTNYLIQNDAIPSNTASTLIVLVLIAIVAIAIMVTLTSVEVNTTS